MDIFKNIDWKKIDNEKLIDFFNANLIKSDELLKIIYFLRYKENFKKNIHHIFLIIKHL